MNAKDRERLKEALRKVMEDPDAELDIFKDLDLTVPEAAEIIRRAEELEQ